MNLFYQDFDKRFRAAVRQHNASPRKDMSDADVIREMAEVWVDSGGESGAFDDHYIAKLRAEIARINRWRDGA